MKIKPVNIRGFIGKKNKIIEELQQEIMNIKIKYAEESKDNNDKMWKMLCDLTDARTEKEILNKKVIELEKALKFEKLSKGALVREKNKLKKQIEGNKKK